MGTCEALVGRGGEGSVDAGVLFVCSDADESWCRVEGLGLRVKG